MLCQHGVTGYSPVFSFKVWFHGLLLSMWSVSFLWPCSCIYSSLRPLTEHVPPSQWVSLQLRNGWHQRCERPVRAPPRPGGCAQTACHPHPHSPAGRYWTPDECSWGPAAPPPGQGPPSMASQKRWLASLSAEHTQTHTRLPIVFLNIRYTQSHKCSCALPSSDGTWVHYLYSSWFGLKRTNRYSVLLGHQPNSSPLITEII